MTYWAELFPVMYRVFNKVEMGYRLTRKLNELGIAAGHFIIIMNTGGGQQEVFINQNTKNNIMNKENEKKTALVRNTVFTIPL